MTTIRFIGLTLLVLLVSLPVQAQLYQTQYRLPGQNWMEIKSERFRVIYPERYRSEAIRAMTILESDYPEIKELVGGSVQNFPIIINPENDRSNGFVSPINFRSEVELSPIIGKTMNPRSGDWFELVLPHELVHVMHFSVNPPSFTRVLGLFSPDVRRSVHGAAPAGVFEGIAVHHESHGSISNSGRGNHPYFRNQFNALINSDQEWSMGQLLHISDYTPPFDRHYIGGYEITHWLLNRYGEKVIRESIKTHYKYPFLGYGVALRMTTGEWPGKLYKDFSANRSEEERERRSNLTEDPLAQSEEILFDADCKRLNRPIWLDNQNLIFYGHSCNRSPGFYQYNLEDGKSRLLHEVLLSRDHIYSMDKDKTFIYYSRLHSDRKYDNLFRGDIERFDMEQQSAQRVTHQMRLFSPEWTDKEILALQIDGTEMNLVSVNPDDGAIADRFEKPENSSVVQIAENPHRVGRYAVIGRIKSVQGIWLTDLNVREPLFSTNPDIVFTDGSVYDVSWHPTEEKLLFVSDHTGVMNLYEYDLEANVILQITDSRFNAFEGSYSPSGDKVAYISQDGNEQKLFVMDRSNSTGDLLSSEEWAFNSQIEDQMDRPLMNREMNRDFDSEDWEMNRYRTGAGWLKPRFWIPTYEKENGLDRLGLRFESVDVMNSQSYQVEVNHYADRIWYDTEYVNRTYFPGFRLELYNSPIFTTLRREIDGEEFRLEAIQQSRGGAVKVPIRYRLESNARFSSFLIEPQYFLSQIRFLDRNNPTDTLSEFGTRHTVGLRSVLNYRIRQFTRDVQPNSGVVFFAEARVGLNCDEFTIRDSRANIDAVLTQRKGIRAGFIGFIAPFSKWNQSLRLDASVYSQTEIPVFNVRSEFSELFSGTPFLGSANVGIFNTRYTIPLVYPDEGGLLLPGYLSNVYLVLFTQTISNFDSGVQIADSRTILGAGIRSRFRISNLAFDVGISVGWEPARNEITWNAGSF
tara:strand:+ start:2789 stop:5707 length:2919 start_codon:yes stop_codon:yes gene_type:complete